MEITSRFSSTRTSRPKPRTQAQAASPAPMSKYSSVDSNDAFSHPSKAECLELFRALKNKDELSHSCREIMEMIAAKDNGVMENDPLNTHGGRRTRGGISHAALQRRFTGKMSGVSLSS